VIDSDVPGGLSKIDAVIVLGRATGIRTNADTGPRSGPGVSLGMRRRKGSLSRLSSHFLIFNPEQVEIRDLVRKLAPTSPPRVLSSRWLQLGCTIWYQSVRSQYERLAATGSSKTWLECDNPSASEGVRFVIISWLRQCVIHNPSARIDLCQKIMSGSTASQQVTQAAIKSGTRMQDDEGESFVGPGLQLTPRTRYNFAMVVASFCLHGHRTAKLT